MRDRSLFGALLLIGAVIPLTSCVSSPSLTSIVVSPSVMNFGGQGLTTQLTAIGHYTRPEHADVTKDITAEVTWASSTPDCVTVNGTGLITSGQNNCSGILVTASAQGFHGIIQGTMTVNVAQPGSATNDVHTIVLTPQTPAPQLVGAQLTFTATGYNAGGAQVQLVNPPTWSSSNPNVATIVLNPANNTGVATMVSAGTTTITAGYSNADGTTATNPQPVTLTVQ